MTPAGFADAVRSFAGGSRGSVTSYIRSAERNRQVGGHPESLHMVGLAADIVYSPNPKPPITQAKRRALKLGMKLIREGDHDHLQAL